MNSRKHVTEMVHATNNLYKQSPFAWIQWLSVRNHHCEMVRVKLVPSVTGLVWEKQSNRAPLPPLVQIQYSIYCFLTQSQNRRVWPTRRLFFFALHSQMTDLPFSINSRTAGECRQKWAFALSQSEFRQRKVGKQDGKTNEFVEGSTVIYKLSGLVAGP